MTRKTMHYAKISVSPEGAVSPSLRVRYDYEDPNIPQPADYNLATIPLPATFGSSIFGTAGSPAAFISGPPLISVESLDSSKFNRTTYPAAFISGSNPNLCRV